MLADSAVEGFAPLLEVGVAPAPVEEAPTRPAEQDIYQMLWQRDEYRAVAPGELIANEFLVQAKPAPGSTCIDFGCGTGRGALNLALFGGLNVTMLDFTTNCLDADILPCLETQAHAFRFQQADITKDIPVSAQYGYCTDVMEHIRPEDVDRTLDNILRAAQHVFFQISMEDDVCGALVGHPLHLSVHPFSWWLKKFQDRECMIHWSKDCGSHALFYVSAWVNAADIVKVGILNISEDVVKENVRTNIREGWRQVQPYETNDFEAMIVGGGPSLAHQLDKIRELRQNGVKLITLNGAYNWALDNGLEPSATVVVDARAFNARFTHHERDVELASQTKYLIASQCDPSVLAGLPKDRTLLWHTTAETIRDVLDEEYGEDGIWYGIPGGSTVLLRAIPLMRMLGYRKFHLFGCDSCAMTVDGKPAHHAYSQAENDNEFLMPVTVGSQMFSCTTWHTSQAQEFMDLIAVFGDEIELEVYGEGLLAYILKHAADLADKERLFTMA